MSEKNKIIKQSVDYNAATYDAVPYTSFPFAHTHPARTGAIAKLFGLDIAPVSTARILEIGCASGGNIIPLAARFPDASFTGLDISKIQVKLGKERIKRLGLKNIEILCESVTDLALEGEPFDYIICHGVFSWVPEQVRDAILAVCGSRLADNGVAMVSYNVLPGWRLRQALRDAMLLYSNGFEDPAQRVQRARWILDFLKEKTAAEGAWGQTFRQEAALLAQSRDDYLLHEFLELTNEPMTFMDFSNGLKSHGLSYLGDTSISSMVPENLNVDTARMVREISNNNVIDVEQSMDIITGRTFRNSLLVKSTRADNISRALDKAPLDALHFIPGIDFHPTAPEGEVHIFADNAGRSIRSSNKKVISAIETMITRLPSSSCLSDLVPSDDKEGKQLVSTAIVQMLQVELLTLSTEPFETARFPSKKPAVAPATRIDSETAEVVANLRHETVNLSPVGKILVPHLDGNNDHDKLLTIVEESVAKGMVSFMKNGVVLKDPEMIKAAALEHLQMELGNLCRQGLFIA